MTTLEFAIGSLATFRLASLIAKEKGPGFIFCKLRNVPAKGSAWAEGLSCPLCVSVWTAIPFAILFGEGDVLKAITLALAFSAVSVCLSLTLGKNL